MPSIFADTVLTSNGWEQNQRISIAADGRIQSIAPVVDTAGGDVHVSVLLPAPGNLHSHAFQHAMAGLTERRGNDPSDSFWTWRKQMFDFLDRLTPDDIQAIAAEVQRKMLIAGYAAVGEFHYLHHQPTGKPYQNPAEMADRIVAASLESGIGLTLLPVLYQVGGCDGRPLQSGQLRFGHSIDSFAVLHAHLAKSFEDLPSDYRLGVAPHSLRATTETGIQACVELAGSLPIHLHLAEQMAEVEEVQRAYGRRPTEWLFERFSPDRQWCLIHCTQLEPHETKMIAGSGAVAGLCPITESSLGDGIFDGRRYLAEAGRIGVGSDSNLRISLAEEIRTLEYSQRLRDRHRAVLATESQSTGRHLLEQTTHGAALALGRNAGRIEAGQLADLVAIDHQHLDLIGRSGDQILDSWFFASDDSVVTDVWSAGRHVVRESRHIRHEEITARFRQTMQRLLAEV